MKFTKLFKMPKWLKPELNNGLYYIHIVILAIVVLSLLELTSYFLLQNYEPWRMLNIFSVLYSIPLLIIGDIVAHSLIQLD